MDRHDLIWNPWHGCHKYSEGCQNCYAFFLDKRYGRDTNEVMRNKSGFDLPIKKDRSGKYKKPFIGEVKIDKYIKDGKVEWVLAGGENYLGSRPLHYEWVEQVYNTCKKYDVKFTFGQTGNIFITNGIAKKVNNRTDQSVEALRTGFIWPNVDIEKEVKQIYKEKDEKKKLFMSKCKK